MKKNQWILYSAGAVFLLALALWARGHVHFQWSIFFAQLRHVDWRRIALAVALIWLGYALRAVRWALLIKGQKKVGWVSLLGSQVIGFAAVALFGRLADLVRPYLVSRRVNVTLSSQVAVYTLERTFDLAATALIFSSALLFAPDRATLPHHTAFRQSALWALAGTVVLGIFALAVRASGKVVAQVAGGAVGALSPGLGQSLAGKILAFRDGLSALQTWRDFLWTCVVSLVMWAGITVAVVETVRAFVLSPQLSSMSLASCLVLMAASMAGSIVQLPVIGWFTQIAATAWVMQSLFHVQSEPALGCGAMLLLVSFMTVIPLGLVWARIDHVSLKKVSQESEHLAAEQTGQRAASSAL